MPLPPEENRRRAREWARKNPDRYKANQDRYRAENREKNKVYQREYREKNRERLRAKRASADRSEHNQKYHRKRYAEPAFAEKKRDSARQWRKANPILNEAAIEKWKRENPERAKAIVQVGSLNRRAKMRALGKISTDDVCTVKARGKCEACGNSHPKMEIDHIVAISRQGTNHLSNLQLLCQPCNRSKWAKDQATWLAERFSSQATV